MTNRGKVGRLDEIMEAKQVKNLLDWIFWLWCWWKEAKTGTWCAREGSYKLLSTLSLWLPLHLQDTPTHFCGDVESKCPFTHVVGDCIWGYRYSIIPYKLHLKRMIIFAYIHLEKLNILCRFLLLQFSHCGPIKYPPTNLRQQTTIHGSGVVPDHNRIWFHNSLNLSQKKESNQVWNFVSNGSPRQVLAICLHTNEHSPVVSGHQTTWLTTDTTRGQRVYCVMYTDYRMITHLLHHKLCLFRYPTTQWMVWTSWPWPQFPELMI